jgi:hypothetical protein
VTKAPFDNVKVRRAVGQAIDRENVVKVAQGFAIPAHSMIPPGFPGAIDTPQIRAIQKYDRRRHRSPQGHSVRGRQELAEDHALDARRGASAPSRSPKRCRPCCSRAST